MMDACKKRRVPVGLDQLCSTWPSTSVIAWALRLRQSRRAAASVASLSSLSGKPCVSASKSRRLASALLRESRCCSEAALLHAWVKVARSHSLGVSVAAPKRGKNGICSRKVLPAYLRRLNQ